MPEREAPNKHVKGSKKYKDWIHKESKFADSKKDLPFTFSKPKKYKNPTLQSVCLRCERCNDVWENTIMVACRCGNLYRTVKNKNYK